MEIVLGLAALMATLVANSLCLVLPFLIAAMRQTGEKKRFWAFVGILTIILPATVAIDWYIVACIHTLTSPGFA